MLTIGKLSIQRALLLAPMEEITDQPFRSLCKEFGADIVCTEFVNSDGLIRNCKKADRKMNISATGKYNTTGESENLTRGYSLIYNEHTLYSWLEL